MSEANAISHMLALRGWLPEPKKNGEVIFTSTTKRPLYNGGEADDIIVIDLSRVDHYKKDENHLFVDLSRDRVYHRTGYFMPQEPDNNGKIFNYVASSRSLDAFYDHIDTLAGPEQSWRRANLEPKRHTPEKWGNFIKEAATCG